MEAQAQKPEAGDCDSAEAEDIPSDFFDDFNKADFIEGLSVIDSWDDKDKGRRSKDDRPRFNEVFEKVTDNSEPMSDEKPRRDGRSRREANDLRGDRTRREASRDDKRMSSKNEPPRQRRSSSITRIDDFIKPGSRRDPNKTNEAIKRDKEVKVKEFLAKSLESSADDLRPPGTELDDYFEGSKPAEKKTLPGVEPLPPKPRSRSRDRRRESPPRKQQHRRPSPKWSPRRSPLRNFGRRPSRSPKRSPRRHSVALWHPNSPPRNSFGYKRFNKNYSPVRERRFSPRRSPRRHSPRRSPHRSPRALRRSRSRSLYRRPLRSRSPSNRDNFLYPSEPEPPHNYGPPPQYQMPPQFGPPSDYQGGPPPTSYPPYAPAYGGYNVPYDYGVPPMPVPQPVPMNPVPAPVPNPVPPPTPNHSVLPVPSPIPPPAVHIPAMVPAPSMVPNPMKQTAVRTPYDALAKLVAEGKISKADYLKLAPNKGTVSTSDDKNRVMVLNRCSSALIKLKTLDLPNQLLFNHAIKLGPEPKYIAPKYCSPLKRQAPVQFQFTNPSGPSSSQQNKHLIDSIIAAVGLEKVVSRPKKKMPKNVKDASCQTTKPFCDVCEIREATITSDAGTSIDRENFCSTVHTQVVEQDLVSSKSMFNPSGSVGDGTMSIAHLTPAQLVSQLAARAKTLKNPEPAPSNQYRRNMDYDYDYNRGPQDNRGGQNQQYQNYNNYNRY